jgi:hypothetical protein
MAYGFRRPPAFRAGKAFGLNWAKRKILLEKIIC